MAKRNRITSEMSKTIAASSPLIKSSPKYLNTPDENSKTEEVEISNLKQNPFQPRIEMNAQHLNDLISSIEANGLMQPIVVAKNGDDYFIVAGHRRAEAFKIMNKKTIPANILKDVSQKDLAVLALTENLIRENLHPVENAIAMKHILEQGVVESQNKLAEYLGLSKGYVSKMMNILLLSPMVIKLVKDVNYRDINVLVLLNKIENEKLTLQAFDEIKNMPRNEAEKHVSTKYLKNIKEPVRSRYMMKVSKTKLQVEIDIKNLDEKIVTEIKQKLEELSKQIVD